MWQEFIYETRGVDSVSNENGFATFIIKGEECYVEDVYVIPTARRKRVASELLYKIIDSSKRAGCIYLTTTVNLAFNDPTSSMKAILSFGFKVTHAAGGIICFKMEI